MRLQEVYFICKSALERLPSYDATQSTIGGKPFYEVKNWAALDAVLTEVYQVQGLRASIDDFRNASKTLHPGTKSTLLTPDEQARALEAYKKFKTALNAVVSTYSSFQIPDHTEGIDIKLPDGISLEQLSAISKDMNMAFEQCPVLRQDGCSISLVAMDVGSMWLSFVAIGTFALNRIAAFIDKCIIIKSHIVSLNAQKEQAKRMSMADDYIENMIEMHKQFTRSVSRTLAEELCSEHSISSNEDIERTRHSIELFGNLMAQGVEVYASIQASKDVQVLFPSIAQQSIPEKLFGVLTEKTSTQAADTDG